MPGAASNGFCPERFAGLIARFETANQSEAEAMNAARALRRMAAMNNLRLVDALERADVRQALDIQLRPVREQSPEVTAALEQAAALREELTERTRNVRELAELLKRQEEANEGLQKELIAVTRKATKRQTVSASASCPARASSQIVALAADSSSPVATLFDGLVGFAGVVLIVVGGWDVAAAAFAWIRSFL